jgi:hypothetical protein
MTKQEAKTACEAQQMTLLSVDDSAEGEAILSYRIDKEYPTSTG